MEKKLPLKVGLAIEGICSDPIDSLLGSLGWDLKHWIHYSWLGSRSPAPGVIASRWAGGMFDAAVTAFGWSPGRRRHKDIRGWACIKAGRNKWLIFLDRSRPLFDDQIKMRGENECFRDQ